MKNKKEENESMIESLSNEQRIIFENSLSKRINQLDFKGINSLPEEAIKLILKKFFYAKKKELSMIVREEQYPNFFNVLFNMMMSNEQKEMKMSQEDRENLKFELKDKQYDQLLWQSKELYKENQKLREQLGSLQAKHTQMLIDNKLVPVVPATNWEDMTDKQMFAALIDVKQNQKCLPINDIQKLAKEQFKLKLSADLKVVARNMKLNKIEKQRIQEKLEEVK